MWLLDSIVNSGETIASTSYSKRAGKFKTPSKFERKCGVKQLLTWYQTWIGGKGANQAVAAAKVSHLCEVLNSKDR